MGTNTRIARRKASLERKAAEVLKTAVPDDDTPITTFTASLGIIPLVMRGLIVPIIPITALFGLIRGLPYALLVVLLTARFDRSCFVTLTGQLVIFHRAGSLDSRPKEITLMVPRDSFSIVHTSTGTSLNVLYYQDTEDRKPVRLNVSRRMWSAEYATFVEALAGPTESG